MDRRHDDLLSSVCRTGEGRFYSREDFGPLRFSLSVLKRILIVVALLLPVGVAVAVYLGSQGIDIHREVVRSARGLFGNSRG